jgi:hypothetical protein
VNKSSARLWAGVIFKDLPRYLPALARGGDAHLSIRNRNERLEPAPDGSGFRCDWKFTSDLHAPRVIPALGRRLMRRALAMHPVERSSASPQSTDAPQVSFIIGHRGSARLPHLVATIESIAAQRGAAIECVVVEQDVEPQVAAHLPSWVRVVHTPHAPGMSYCRSWSFNIGAMHARAPALVLHDNDMLVPIDYAAQVLARFARGYEAANLKRFIFYLDRGDTDAVLSARARAKPRSRRQRGDHPRSFRSHRRHGRVVHRLGRRRQRVLGTRSHAQGVALGGSAADPSLA